MQGFHEISLGENISILIKMICIGKPFLCKFFKNRLYDFFVSCYCTSFT